LTVWVSGTTLIEKIPQSLKEETLRLFIFILIGVVALSAAGPVFAPDSAPKGDPPRDPFVLDWWTIDGGGGPVAGGDFELLTTIGQPDAGTAVGGDYLVQGGFLPGGVRGLPFNDGFESGNTDRWDATVGGRQLRGGE
jgi:hypothetical protein